MSFEQKDEIATREYEEELWLNRPDDIEEEEEDSEEWQEDQWEEDNPENEP